MKRLEDNRKIGKLSYILKMIVVVIFCIILVINIWFLFSKYVLGEELPSVLGYKTAVVLTGSMDPTFSAGDILIYHEETEYEVGDVVIFECDGYYVTHRIVGTEGGYFITKGDANNVEDMERLDSSNIEGKMVFIMQGIGDYVNIFTTPFGMLVLLLLGVLVFEVPKFFKKEK